jgi:hypothetical protein
MERVSLTVTNLRRSLSEMVQHMSAMSTDLPESWLGERGKKNKAAHWQRRRLGGTA